MNKRTAQHAGMATIARVGMDTSKKYVQLHGINAAEQLVLKKQMKREDVLAILALHNVRRGLMEERAQAQTVI